MPPALLQRNDSFNGAIAEDGGKISPPTDDTKPNETSNEVNLEGIVARLQNLYPSYQIVFLTFLTFLTEYYSQIFRVY